jgi:hypothetical protein
LVEWPLAAVAVLSVAPALELSEEEVAVEVLEFFVLVEKLHFASQDL